MRGLAVQLLCAAVLLVTVIETLADKPKKNLKKFPPQGPPFIPPLPLPANPAFRFPPVTQAPSILDPYACLPKYLCIVKNKKGEKRTTIVHGLHPALRKAKPSVIDPSKLPTLPGGKKPFPLPVVSVGPDDEIYRDREFNDSFLKQQEMAEAMALLEEKRRQFLYQMGMPKQKIIPKGGEKIKTEDDDERKSKESEEEADKSQEVSKEDEKDEETDKSVEISKEEDKEESAEEESSSENEKSRSKLSKYKIKKKLYSKQFKARINDYEDVDSLDDHLATVPWDDRLRNDTDPLKPSEIYDKLFGKVLPAFQFASLPKIAKNIPGISFLTSGSTEEPTTTTTQRPGLFKRMLRRVTGGGSGGGGVPPPPIKRRNGPPPRRYRRDAAKNMKLISEDMKIIKEIRDPARQCRMIFKGCDLPYDHIMKMVSTGQVLIENDHDIPTTKQPVSADPAFAQDDEADQAIKEKMAQKNKSPKPIPQMLAQASLGSKKKVYGAGGLPIFGKNKKKPILGGSSEEYSDNFRPKPKKKVASLPLIPMRYQWGKPAYNVNGRPTEGLADFSGGVVERVVYKPTLPPTTTTTTTPRPIFAAMPLDKRDNLTAPTLQHSVIKLNKTHAVHVLSKKPYNPPKTKTRDAKGQPVSFSSVFTEIAGQTGGIHDFFDRISGAFGGDGTRESARELSGTFPGSDNNAHGYSKVPSPHAKPTAFPSAPIPADHMMNKEEEGQSAERDDEDSGSEEDQEEDDEDNEGPENEEPENEEPANEEPENEEPANEEPENDEEQDEEEDAGDNEDIAYDLDQIEQGIQPESKHKQKPKQPTVQASQTENEQSQEQSEPETQIKTKKPVNNKNKPEDEVEKEEENEESEEEEENDEEEIYNLPENIPPFIKQSMIEDIKRKKQEKQQGGQQGGGQGQGGGRPGQGGGHQQQQPHYGRPGQGPNSQGQPPRGGGFLSSLFSRN